MIKQLNNIIQGKELGAVTLDNDNVSNLNIFLNTIKISTGDDGPLVLSSAPLKTASIDLTFESGVEFEEVKIEVFRTQTEIVFSIVLPRVELHLHTSPDQISQLQYELKMKRTGDFGKLSDELRTVYLLKEIATPQKLTIFIKGQPPMNFQTSYAEPLAELTEKYVYYFERLKKIEKHFGVKFDNIGEITTQSFNTLNLIIAHVEGCPWLGEFDQAWAVQPNDPEKALQFLAQVSPHSELVQKSSNLEIINFHGKKLSMGYRTIRLLEPYVVDLDQVKNDPAAPFEIRSKSKTIAVTYSSSYK